MNEAKLIVSGVVFVLSLMPGCDSKSADMEARVKQDVVPHADLAALTIEKTAAAARGPFLQTVARINTFSVYAPWLPIVSVDSAKGDLPGPEVMLVRLAEPPTLGDEYVAFGVEQLKDRLDTSGCESSAGCRGYRARFGEEYVVRSACTGAFVAGDDAAHQIVTAAHCLPGSDFDQIYGVVGYHAKVDWEISGGQMHVPIKNLVRLCHVDACGFDEHKVTDFALVHVCPIVPTQDFVGHESLAIAARETGLESPMFVHSHGLGLPAKRYTAAYQGHKLRTAMFTNFGAGSGSAVVNSGGEVVGVVKGTVSHGEHITCPGDLDFCNGQRVTWIDAIHDLRNARAVCSKDHPLPVNHEFDCE